jgi:DNA polymerase V
MKTVTFIPAPYTNISAIGTFAPAQCCPIPFFGSDVPAGFPSPAEGWVERSLDLNDLCIRNPDSSYFVRVRGESMINAGINDSDVLVIDRAITYTHNAIVVARVGSELTVKRLLLKPVKRLVPENPAFQPIDTEGLDVEIIGVATFAIKRLF